ncbi:MAG: transposase [Tenacibaculum sp.]
MKTKRTFSTEEKLSILRETSENRVKPTLDKHGIYPATYYSWRKKFNEMGEEGLSHEMTTAHLKRIRELEKENQKLKELVAKERLAGKINSTCI